MSSEFTSLSVTAITIGFFHCLLGPDHYVPFVAMSRVGLWSLRKTLLVTLLCGIGHVAGSAVLGFIGIALGLIVFQLDGFENAESLRGVLAGWLLVAFGLAYFAWGLVCAVRQRTTAGSTSEAELLGDAESKVDALTSQAGSFTPWILFAIFLFGPCEPLIPTLMVPALKANVWGVVWVTALFGLTTLATMTALVALIYVGTFAIRWQFAQVYGHALAGFIILICGLAILLGL